MPGEVMPFERRDHAFGRWFVGGHVGSQSDLAQRADWLGPACNLACGTERSNEGWFQIETSSKPEEPAQTFTRHQHQIVTSPIREPMQPRLYWRSIGGIADSDHWTGDSIGAALFQNAEQWLSSRVSGTTIRRPLSSSVMLHHASRQPRLVVSETEV